MHAIHIQRLGDNAAPYTAWFSIEKDDGISFLCVCHTKNSTLTNTLHRICTDHIVDLNPTERSAVHVFTELLERLNHELDTLHIQYKNPEISLFIGLLMGSHVHFSMFGRELTGIIVSSSNIEDVFSDMDNGEGHFVYDSHGDIRANETFYVFAPKVDTHVIGGECMTLTHLTLPERCQLLSERIERSYANDSIILSISEEKSTTHKTQWNSEKISLPWQKSAKILGNVRRVSEETIQRVQDSFSTLSRNTKNWVFIVGLLMSIALLYMIITSVMNSQYTLFVPQKYKDMVAEARVDIDDATRMVDQPDNFGPAITRAQDIINKIKAAGVLKIDVAQLDNDISVLERAVNKVTSLKTDDYISVYKFWATIDSLPFSMYTYDKKLTLVTTSTIVWPFIPGEVPKETKIPNGEKYTFSDVDGEGRIYVWTDQDKIYLFDKWLMNTLNVGQVGGWDKGRGLSVYNGNIYLLGGDAKQIYKYRRQSENSYSGRSLVLNDTQTNPIVGMDIDGSVWLLSGTNKLSLEKILTAPNYERRPIVVNSLGINTFQDINPDTTKIYAGDSYQEIYILADNHIWVFVPSSKRFSDVRFVTYVGQIDVPNMIITDLTIEQDGDVRKIYFGSPKSGIFSTKMTITDNKIHILPSK